MRKSSMISLAKRIAWKPRAASIAFALGFGLLLSLRATAMPARAQQADPAAVVIAWLNAQAAGDATTALAQFAPNAVFIGTRPTGSCSAQTPCTDLAGITQQIQGSIAAHGCFTLRWIQVSSAVVTGEREIRNDTARANGVDRVLQIFIAVVPEGKITFFAGVQDAADPETALNAAINAGTQSPGTPIAAPTTPCPPIHE